jgi:serine phosphatase RsbU (regulator of sigma subunit)/anti-sigma regulatory factor (Ser/Thr protein kinase)
MDGNSLAGNRVLVLEDDPLRRDLIALRLQNAGLEPITLASLTDARAFIDQTPPDLMIVGREFERRSSLDFVRGTRERDPAHWLPIVMLGVDHGSIAEADALRAGCDDCLANLVSHEVLNAKLATLLRMRRLRRVAERQRIELAAFRDRAENEAELAKFLLSRLSRIEHLDDAGVAYHWAPAEGFSGDLLAATRSSTGDLYGLLADATGHGLAAAINLIPLTTAFYAMSGKGFNLETIIEQLNKVVKDYSLADRFVAVTLVRFSSREQRLEVVNAGNPPALLLGRQRQVIREISSGSVPLGILDRSEFRPRIEAIELFGGEELLMYSDGLVEACNPGGRAFGRPGVNAALIGAAPGHVELIGALRTAFEQHSAGLAPADDVSLMVLTAPVPAVLATPRVSRRTATPEAAQTPAAASALARRDKHCGVEVSFSSIELQRIDVVPVIVDLTRNIGLRKSLESRFFTVLSELYANALDHGLLRLDSTLKSEPDGFERYLARRSERLAALDEGAIVVRIDHWYGRAGGGRMRIAVCDTGPGFDHQRYLRSVLGEESDAGRLIPSGRGLALLLTLCDRVSFNLAGNEVITELSYG